MDNYAYQSEDNNGKPFAISRYPSVNPEVSNNYLVEVNSRAKYLQKPKFYQRLSWLLTAILVLLVIALIVLVIIFCKERQHLRICTSDECLRSATNLRYSIDFEADPCDDFYDYVCGHWSQEHPNHGWFASFSTFATISEKVLIATENFLTAEIDDEAPVPVKQAKDLYKSCMDAEAMERLGYSVVHKYLKEAELPLIPSLFTATQQEIVDFKFDWLRSDAIIKKLFAMDVLIGFNVAANDFNRSENVMYIGTPDARCPLPSPLRKNSLSGKKRRDTDEGFDARKEANAKIVKFILVTLIKNVTSAEPKEELLQEAVDVLLNMTQFMDELISNYTFYETESISLPQSFRTLETEINDLLTKNSVKNYPDMFRIYVKQLFEGTNITVDTNTDFLYVIEPEREYLPKLFSYILTTSDIYLELYMWWVTVFAMIINTTDEVISEIIKETSQFYSGGEVLRSRSLECASLTQSFMGVAVSYGLADKAFVNTTKPKVERMVYEIKNAFVEHVNHLTWMDKDTKEATLEKAREMLSFVGYPEWLFEKGELEKHYQGIEISNDTYLENMMMLTKDFMPKKFKALRDTNERTWKTDPITVNAFNSFTDNAINIPMAILNFPMYNLGLEVLNYAAVGSIVGHEITHGFDNTGRKHDKFGNYKQWWTNETIDTFEEKIECFVKQYDNFTIDGIEDHVNGKQTLGENLADNGGLNLAFIAYQNHLKHFGNEKRLPGFDNFTNNQLFFVAYASIWCEDLDLDSLSTQIKYDEHSPNNIRVRGTMQNYPHFSDAFKCPKGSKMNPDVPKCKVW